MRRAVAKAIKQLHPGYFALVMATGIVSIAAHLLGLSGIARSLFLANLAAYLSLWLLSCLRLVFHSSLVAAELGDFSKGPTFLTVVAASCVLGSQFVILDRDGLAALLLWLLGCALWVVLTYLFLTMTIVRKEKPPLELAMDGTWLLLVVSTQSIAVLGTLLGPLMAPQEVAIQFVALAAFLLGTVLYIVLISLITYRLIFRPLEPAQFTPPYWINMGAAAITTLSGTSLAGSAPRWSLLAEMLPAVTAVSLMFWIVASWWIPILIGLEARSRIRERVVPQYRPSLWTFVFPLGMYATCTFELGKVMGLPILLAAAGYEFYLALIAWTAVSLAMVRGLWGLREAESEGESPAVHERRQVRRSDIETGEGIAQDHGRQQRQHEAQRHHERKAG